MIWYINKRNIDCLLIKIYQAFIPLLPLRMGVVILGKRSSQWSFLFPVFLSSYFIVYILSSFGIFSVFCFIILILIYFLEDLCAFSLVMHFIYMRKNWTDAKEVQNKNIKNGCIFPFVPRSVLMPIPVKSILHFSLFCKVPIWPWKATV